MKKLLIFMVTLNLFSCGSATVGCNERKSSEKLNINTCEGLISYLGNEDVEIGLIVLDSRIISREILEKVIFDRNHQLISAKSIYGADGRTLDGEPKRNLILESDICNSWRIIKGLNSP